MRSDADQRRFVMLLCLRCGNGDETLHDEEVAFQLRISNDEWLQTKAVFLERNLIDEHNHPVAWDKRQFRSDSSTERVRRHRAAKKSSVKRECNVTVTHPDTDTDTDTDNTPLPPTSRGERFDRFWAEYPKKRSKGQAERAFAKLNPNEQLLADILRGIKRAKTSEQWQRDGGQFIPYPATWL